MDTHPKPRNRAAASTEPATVPISASNPVSVSLNTPPPTNSLPPRYRAPPGTNAVVPVIECNLPTSLPSSSQKTHRKPIDVYLTGGNKCGGAAHIWSAADALRLRNEFRILGDFVGTLPKHTAQNQFLTMPLVLSYEELNFGVTRGFIRMLRDDSTLDYSLPTPQDVDLYYKKREEEREKYADEAIANQERQRKNRMANGSNLKHKQNKKQNNKRTASDTNVNQNQERVVGKKRKREEENPERPAKTARTEGFFGRVTEKVWNVITQLFPRFAKKETVDIHETESNSVLVENLPSDEEEEEKEPSQAALDKQAIAVLARRREQAKQAAVLETACVAVDRNDYAAVVSELVPKNVSPKRLLARQLVFADLYDKGYAMSCGAKFGADYLAYAGDPALFHASLAVIVMNSTERVSMYDVIALGRLGDSTKKRTALAYVDGDASSKYTVRYVGVQWEETLP